MTPSLRKGARIQRFDNASEVPIIAPSETPPQSGWSIVGGGSVVYCDGVQVGHSAKLEIRDRWAELEYMPTDPAPSDG